MPSDENVNSGNCLLFSEDDIVEAMKEIPGYIDITPGDFKLLCASSYAYARKKMLQSIQAHTIMHSPALCITQEKTVADLLHILADNGISGLPVLDEQGKIVGVVSEKDVLRILGKSPQSSMVGLMAASLSAPFALRPEEQGTRVKDIMTSPPIVLHEDDTLGAILELFHSRAVNRLPVINAEKTPVGIISRHDVIQSFGRLL